MSFDFSPANLDREFPVRRNLVYFNHAAVAPLPRRVADAIDRARRERPRPRAPRTGARWYGDDRDDARRRRRASSARRAAEIAFLPNTSWGSTSSRSAFRGRTGDNVVTDDMEFPSNAYPWRALERARRRVPRGRRAAAGASRSTTSPRSSTRARASSPSRGSRSTTAWSSRSPRSARLCRERGILFVVDAIQGLGALPIDVARRRRGRPLRRRPQVALRRRRAARSSTSPRERATASRATRAAGGTSRPRASYLEYRATPYAGARRYEPGTLPTDHIARPRRRDRPARGDGSRRRARARSWGSCGALADGLAARGWRIATPEPLASGILAAAPPGGDARSWAKALEQRGVIVAPREGAVRFSPHAGNDDGEIARALAEIDYLAPGAGAASG